MNELTFYVEIFDSNADPVQITNSPIMGVHWKYEFYL
jgi:hypothetical protein